jgi:hypothetical protein
MDDKSLNAFIERAARLAKSKSDRLTEADVRDIALEVGLSEEDLARAKREGQDHLERGREFMHRQRYGDAVAEFDEALALLPGRIEARVELANARAHRFLAHGNPMDRQRAEQLARECLEIDPSNDAAYNVLDLIEPDNVRQARAGAANAGAHSPGSGAGRSGNSAAVLFALAAVGTLLVLGGGAVGWLLMSGDADHGGPPAESEKVASPPAVVDEVSPEQASPQTPPGTPTKPSTRGTRELQVDVTDRSGNGLGLEVRSSEMRPGSDNAFYRLKGLVLNEGDNEIEEIKARVVFVDENGEALKSESGRRILSSHEPIMRPGGAHAFGLLLRGHPDARGLQLEYEWAKAVPTDGSYSPSTPIELHREAGQERWQLGAAEREMSWSERSFSDDGFFRATFEMTNKGGGPIRSLKLKAEFYDAAGQLIGQDETYVVTSSEPPLLPGETRPVSVLETTSADYDHYRLVVASIK